MKIWVSLSHKTPNTDKEELKVTEVVTDHLLRIDRIATDNKMMMAVKCNMKDLLVAQDSFKDLAKYHNHHHTTI